MASTDNMSSSDQEFLAKCEEELKHRFTEDDAEFMKVFNTEPSVPPIIESWWVPQNAGRRNDRRNNRRNHQYERHGDREDRRDRRGYNDNQRGYRDYDRGYNDHHRDRSYGDRQSSRNQRSRY